MGNLIWTGILYFSTFGIVFLTFRTFILERRADGAQKTEDMIKRNLKTPVGR